MDRVQGALQLLVVGVGAFSLAACSCEASARVGPANNGGGGGMGGAAAGAGGGGTSGGGTSGGGTSGGGTNGGGTAGGGAGGASAEAGATVTVSSAVFDASTGTGFDTTAYTALEGVQVCVEDDATIPCATTAADGTYSIDVPASTAIVLTFVKDGFSSTRYAITSQDADSTVQDILMPSDTQTADFNTAAGFTADSSFGSILFGALTPSTNTSAAFYTEIGGNGFEYVEGFSVSITPAADNGPVFVGTDWNPDPALTTSSAAGWGAFYTAPGDYTLTITHPELNCGTVPTATVVTGWVTTWVGTVCSSVTSDGGAGDGGSTDAGGGPDAATDGGDGG